MMLLKINVLCFIAHSWIVMHLFYVTIRKWKIKKRVFCLEAGELWVTIFIFFSLKHKPTRSRSREKLVPRGISWIFQHGVESYCKRFGTLIIMITMIIHSGGQIITTFVIFKRFFLFVCFVLGLIIKIPIYLMNYQPSHHDAVCTIE